MKIFLTGATGLLGSHCAHALLQAGYELRLLARQPAVLRQHFARLGWSDLDVVAGDMQDAAAMHAALQGCDAVVHAAAAVNLDPRQATQTLNNNVQGVQHVLGAACEMGMMRMVYASSLSVLFHPDLPKLDENTPLVNSRNPYSQSKIMADQLVRSWQQQGAPVQSLYPSVILAPDDPKLSQSNQSLQIFVSRALPITRSGFQFVDARDVAAMLVQLLAQPAPAVAEDGRYMVAGHYLSWPDLRRSLETVLGKKVPARPLPAGLLRLLGWGADALQQLRPFETALSAESVEFMTRWSPADSSRICAATGLHFRPVAETFADTLAWMQAAGHLPPGFLPASFHSSL